MKTLLKIVLTLLAFWLALWNVSWAELKEAYIHQAPVYLWAATGIILLQNIFGGWRWHHIRAAMGGAARENITLTTVVYYASNFFNVCLPSTVGGDIARVWLSRSQFGDHTKDALYGVIIDRLMSLLGLALLVLATLPSLAEFFDINRDYGLIASVVCYVLIAMFYLMIRLLLPRLQELLPFRFLNDIFAALQRIVDKFWRLACAAFWSVAAHVCYATLAYALALSLGIQISWYDCLVLLPIVLFISTIPVTLGGWGIRELGMAGMLALAGVPAAKAIVLSVQMGLLSTFISLFGGLFYLSFKKKGRD